MSDLTILPRARWNATPPALARTRRTHSSITELYIHWPGGEPASWASTKTQADEAEVLRGFQHYHIHHNGWADIAYNHVLGGGRDGHPPRVWTARGAQYVPAAQLGHNSGTIAICVLVGPRDPIFQNIIDRLRSYIRWAEDYTGNRLKVGGHRQAPGQSTECPGAELMHAIRAGKLNIH